MNPYINPWFFYWVSVSDAVRVLLYIIGSSCAVATLIMVVGNAVDAYDMDDFKDEIKIIKKPLTVVATVALVSIIVATFLPTEEVAVKMVVARAITPDNVSKGIESVKEAIDYIVQKIAEIK